MLYFKKLNAEQPSFAAFLLDIYHKDKSILQIVLSSHIFMQMITVTNVCAFLKQSLNQRSLSSPRCSPPWDRWMTCRPRLRRELGGTRRKWFSSRLQIKEICIVNLTMLKAFVHLCFCVWPWCFSLLDICDNEGMSNDQESFSMIDMKFLTSFALFF